MASPYKTSTFNVLRNLLVFPCHSGLNHHVFVIFRFSGIQKFQIIFSRLKFRCCPGSSRGQPLSWSLLDSKGWDITGS